MHRFYWEPFVQIVNSELVHIVDEGPLHAPIASFELTRDDKLRLI